jgi:SAM-dependent methyltransferase
VHEYDTDFYSYNASLAIPSANRIVPKLMAVIQVRSVVDFGCGEGAWLHVWAEAGVSVTGVDGPYIDRRRLLIDPRGFHAADLAEPINLGRNFDIVQSLEVAEHLPAVKAGQFVDTLTRHGSIVLFSAAVPGQGGENHINEQPLEYWRRLFGARGYAAVDYLRPLISSDPTIAPWYRYNTMLYIRKDTITSLAEPACAARISDDREPNNYWPFGYRLRHAVVRRLPRRIVNRLSQINAALPASAAGKRLPRRQRHV